MQHSNGRKALDKVMDQVDELCGAGWLLLPQGNVIMRLDSKLLNSK